MHASTCRPASSIDASRFVAASMPGRRRDRAFAAIEPGAPPTNPGDDAPEGTPGTGENLCPRCDGTGRTGGSPCPDCAGTGKVNVGIGGA